MNGNYQLIEVSRILQTTPSKVLTWTKQYNIPFTLSEKGSHLYEEASLAFMKKIKVKEEKKQNAKHVSIEDIENKLEKLMEKITYLEDKLSQKADEVVSYQLLQHRSDIEAIDERLNKIESSFLTLDTNGETNEKNQPVIEYDRSKKKRILGVFGLSN